MSIFFPTRYLAQEDKAPLYTNRTGAAIKTRPSKVIPLGNVNNDINYDFTSYIVVRDRVNQQIENTEKMLNSPNSSLKKCINQISYHPFLKKEKANIDIIFNEIKKNISTLKKSSASDINTYFNTMNKFIENVNILHLKLLSYSATSDPVDEFNPQEAAVSLSRVINDFKELERIENHFPKNFRQFYIEYNI